MVVVYCTVSSVFWGGLLASFVLKRDAADVLISTLFAVFLFLIINAMVYNRFMGQLPSYLYFVEAILAVLALYYRIPYRRPLQATSAANKAASFILSALMFAFAFYFVFEVGSLFSTHEDEEFLLKMGGYMLNSTLIVITGGLFFKKAFA